MWRSTIYRCTLNSVLKTKAKIVDLKPLKKIRENRWLTIDNLKDKKK